MQFCPKCGLLQKYSSEWVLQLGVFSSAGEILYLITPNSPFSNSCFIVDVSWHVSILDKAGLVAVVILTEGWTEGLWEKILPEYCHISPNHRRQRTMLMTTELHRVSCTCCLE